MRRRSAATPRDAARPAAWQSTKGRLDVWFDHRPNGARRFGGTWRHMMGWTSWATTPTLTTLAASLIGDWGPRSAGPTLGWFGEPSGLRVVQPDSIGRHIH